MTYREAGEDQPIEPVTCRSCGHVFSPPSLSFTVDGDADDGGGISFALPVGVAGCPRCGAPID